MKSVDKADGRNDIAAFMLFEPRVPDSILFRRNVVVALRTGSLSYSLADDSGFSTFS